MDSMDRHVPAATLKIFLPPDLEEWVKAKVQSGQYNSVSEVVHHGLYLLQDQDTLRQIKLERLRKDIAVGIEAAERGEVAPLDIEDIIARGKERLAEANRRSDDDRDGAADQAARPSPV